MSFANRNTQLDLSIIIVSWNVSDLLRDCLASIQQAPLVRVEADGTAHGQQGPRTEVLIVDSASSDGSVAMIREQFPWVYLIALDENVGFVQGNNIALELAQGRYLLLLNPDTMIHDDALTILTNFLDEHPDTGIVGPRVLNPDGTTQSTRRRFLTSVGGLFESTWLQGYAPRRILDHYYMNDFPDTGTFDADWVQGCALMARRTVYEQIGGLDPGFVMFFEEVDWCRRAKDAGWRVFYVGDAQITHYGGQSTDQVETQKHIHFQQSKVRYYHKHFGFWTALALRTFLLLSYSAQIALEGGKIVLGHKVAMRRARIVTYRHVIRALALGYRIGY
jgi:N-acetylglucosaminyl-diphospho-decaprenol L-rhamnosyltransferase